MCGFLALALLGFVAFGENFDIEIKREKADLHSLDISRKCAILTNSLRERLGKTVLPDCSSIGCYYFGKELAVRVRRCGKNFPQVPPGLYCRNATDTTKPYPECCPKLECRSFKLPALAIG